MESFGDSEQCITLHPGFQDVGLKTKSGKTYRTLFDQGQRSEAEFFLGQWHTGNLLDYSGTSLEGQDTIHFHAVRTQR